MSKESKSNAPKFGGTVEEDSDSQSEIDSLINMDEEEMQEVTKGKQQQELLN